MKTQRFINIDRLYGFDNKHIRIGKDLNSISYLEQAFLEVEDGRVLDYGLMSDLPYREMQTIDMFGKTILPSYVDCHTHLVFAETREQEFEDRLNGLTYQEIASRGGGILNSADKLGRKPEDELFEEALKRLNHLIKLGTGAIEIKSGYGLTTDSELKMLRVIDRIKSCSPIPVKATFLGAHAYPTRFKDNHEGYLQEVLTETLPAVAKSKLADYVDVFCEKGYFELADTERILLAANSLGLKTRIHVNQFNAFGGIKLAKKQQVLSVEHLEVMSEDDFDELKNSDLFAVALPACSFFLKIPYTPARRLIDSNVRFVLASDFNPGSTPTGNLNFVYSLACLYMGMTPTEAFNALTINAAHALELEAEVGSLDKGKRANFMVLPKSNTLASIAYNFADSIIDEVYVNGEVYN